MDQAGTSAHRGWTVPDQSSVRMYYCLTCWRAQVPTVVCDDCNEELIKRGWKKVKMEEEQWMATGREEKLAKKQDQQFAFSKTSRPEKKQQISQEAKHAIAECPARNEEEHRISKQYPQYANPMQANAQKLTRKQRKTMQCLNEQEMDSTETLAEPPFATTSDEEDHTKNMPCHPSSARRMKKKKVSFKIASLSV